MVVLFVCLFSVWDSKLDLGLGAQAPVVSAVSDAVGEEEIEKEQDLRVAKNSSLIVLRPQQPHTNASHEDRRHTETPAEDFKVTSRHFRIRK
ncbi:unnamed protein product [Taenia asiatica]|uniref:Secreted protein n=1 Tax=Taenia asiatica TaxID=60517 RepID=A0A0R3VZ70_TAEAS|nr:unnamed protein product [Taenia asiatica]